MGADEMLPPNCPTYHRTANCDNVAAPSRHAPTPIRTTIPSDGGSIASSDDDGGSIAPCSHPHHHTIRRRLHDGSITSSDDNGGSIAPCSHPSRPPAWRRCDDDGSMVYEGIAGDGIRTTTPSDGGSMTAPSRHPMTTAAPSRHETEFPNI
eukprot:CAMPEP_0201986746 /NCGR_PEP_ID=MMETSP0904-20121228/91436_1 /ASSEMBLY_ACC=CAM_ASM_000553 /TAXON_ID=420261 /ORGANISM="Thalassiosira antarctica, Strain CCMP982" /LENGTH=150 /DNA_ID=CAMNT_0048540819 /DNA_START=26 /DNA_END=478 /DNA_ORIENTATION=+